jgi:hypothetical protein
LTELAAKQFFGPFNSFASIESQSISPARASAQPEHQPSEWSPADDIE